MSAPLKGSPEIPRIYLPLWSCQTVFLLWSMDRKSTLTIYFTWNNEIMTDIKKCIMYFLKMPTWTSRCVYNKSNKTAGRPRVNVSRQFVLKHSPPLPPALHSSGWERSFTWTLPLGFRYWLSHSYKYCIINNISSLDNRRTNTWEVCPLSSDKLASYIRCDGWWCYNNVNVLLHF